METKQEKRGRGRPTLYKPEYAKLAYKFCLLGATNEKLAQMFEVDVTTIDLWLKTHEEFSGSIKEGREVADANVSSSLYHRAMGYDHKAVKIFNDGGVPLVVDYVERYPPDTTAAIFWLKNRQRDQWREKSEQAITSDSKVELSGSVEIPGLADRIAKFKAK